MPNWCENELTIDGPNADLQRFKSLGGIDFNAVLPYPADLQRLDDIHAEWERTHPFGSEAFTKEFESRPKDGYNQGGYEWCVKTWGVKWNVVDDEKEPVDEDPTRHGDDNGRLKYRFDTPWGPPKLVLHAWSAAYPMLTFRLEYWEGGMGFQGTIQMLDGRTLKAIEGEYVGDRGG